MGKTVLTVDDSKSIRDMIGFTLEPHGYRVIGAADGAEGLRVFGEETVHFVLTDLNMPVMNGIDFIKEVRKTARGAGVPIVMLTTESKPEIKAIGKAAGATGWISKPFDAEMLIAVTRKLAG
jgi:two-component system, chemotaxis family, chemotaxis protein CheY